jgi:hypothetical protein
MTDKRGHRHRLAFRSVGTLYNLGHSRGKVRQAPTWRPASAGLPETDFIKWRLVGDVYPWGSFRALATGLSLRSARPRAIA